MNGPTETQEIEINLAPLAGAKVAYTINNQQPVRSSFIGTEPLFFMDTDEIFDEDGLFDDDTFEFLADDLELLKQKIDSYDAVSREFEADAVDVESLFSEDASFMTSELPNETTLEQLIEVIKKSRFADTLIDFAQQYNVSVEYSRQVKVSEYDRDAGKVFLHPSLDFGYQILMLSSELRRVWQHKQGAAIDPLAFYPDHGILINRLQQADVNAFMIPYRLGIKVG